MTDDNDVADEKGDSQQSARLSWARNSSSLEALHPPYKLIDPACILKWYGRELVESEAKSSWS